MNKVVFFVTKSVNPYPRLEKEADTLSRKGYSVKIFAWDRERKDPPTIRKNGWEVVNLRLRSPYNSYKLAFYFLIWWAFQIKQLIKEEYDIVHVFNLDTLLPALIIGKLRHKKVVYDVADFYASMIGKKLAFPFLVKLVSGMEIYLAKKADLVILADDSRIEEFHGELRNWISLYNCYSRKMMPERIPVSRSGFTIFYGGVLYKRRGLFNIGSAIKELENVTLIIAGYGGEEQEIREFFKEYKNVALLGRVSLEEIIDYSIKSDLLFALYDPRIMSHRHSSPNKLFMAMMLGKPIIVSRDTGMDRIVEREDCGLVVDYDDVSGIKEAILTLMENKGLAKRLGENGIKAFENQYNWEAMEEKLLGAYRSL